MSFSLLVKIINSSGYLINQKLLGLDTLHYFLQRNLGEFDDSVESYIEGEDLWYEQNSKNLELHMLEIARRVHNYISVYYSLFEQTQKFRKELDDKNFDLKYKKKVEEIFNPIESLLIKHLREYFQHYDIPPIKVKIENESFGYGKDKKIVLLDSGKLLKYERLNAKLKEYIKSNEIDLVELIHSHNTRLKEFYKWFNSILSERYREELKELSQYEKEYRESIEH